jgi:hypothetical protein
MNPLCGACFATHTRLGDILEGSTLPQGGLLPWLEATDSDSSDTEASSNDCHRLLSLARTTKNILNGQWRALGGDPYQGGGGARTEVSGPPINAKPRKFLGSGVDSAKTKKETEFWGDAKELTTEGMRSMGPGAVLPFSHRFSSLLMCLWVTKQ